MLVSFTMSLVIYYFIFDCRGVVGITLPTERSKIKVKDIVWRR